MRNIRKSWGSRDRVSLLQNTSPPPSPSSRYNVPSTPNVEMEKSNNREEQQISPKAMGSIAAPIQFVPAYDHGISPSTTPKTHPPTPEDSSPEGTPPLYRRTSRPRTAPAPVQYRKNAAAPDPPAMSASSMEPPSGNNSKKGNTRIGRLASLFSSRAIVRSMDEEEKEGPCSPPRSESSSGYVGWPGTQDKRGATVAIESSCSESDHVTKPFTSDSFDSNATANQEDFFVSAVANSNAAAQSPLANHKTIHASGEVEKVHRLAKTPLQSQVRSLQDIYGNEQQAFMNSMTDPWGTADPEFVDHDDDSYSKTSSAYFSPSEVRAIRSNGNNNFQRYSETQTAAVMRFAPGEPQPPTEEALAIKNHLTPPHRTMANSVGFRGLLDKSKDVPNLMDGTESDSTSSTGRHSTIPGSTYQKPSQQRKRTGELKTLESEDQSDIFDGVTRDNGSDVFDGLSYGGSRVRVPTNPSIPEDREQTLGAIKRDDNENLNLVMLGGGLTTIQTTANDFSNRATASDFDETLSNSDVDQYGFAKIPDFSQMVASGTRPHDRSLSGNSFLFTKPSPPAQEQTTQKYQQQQTPQKCQQNINCSRSHSSSGSSSLFSSPYAKEGWGHNMIGGLEQYYVHPDKMKIVVRKFRELSSIRHPDLGFDEYEREEDATKVFALSEMRSRIMEKDIERGLERRGGTTVVDDIVLTPYNQAAMRVRDAIIVAKAWRDGATPIDIVNTSQLTRRAERAYFIPRPVNRRHNGFDTTRSPEYFAPVRYSWEEVLWMDDMEMTQYKCHSIGPRHLSGFEMFSIGDCQSILLKLCNERCMELRAELNEATARQIEAEELMKEEEIDVAFDMMTEAETIYLSSMEKVKIISHKLVVAEKAFTLVKDRIEKLVHKYEALLLKFENDAESIAPSSIITASSYYSDCSGSSAEEREREMLARRAQRAELRAELAAREALMAKHQVRAIRDEKEQEIEKLQKRLQELQSESSTAIAEREHSVVLARAIAAKNRGSSCVQSNSRISQNKIEDVKQRFRNRSAGRVQNRGNTNYASAGSAGYRTSGRDPRDSAMQARSNMFRAVGEEMFQHLDFYERSLKAVETAQQS